MSLDVFASNYESCFCNGIEEQVKAIQCANKEEFVQIASKAKNAFLNTPKIFEVNNALSRRAIYLFDQEFLRIPMQEQSFAQKILGKAYMRDLDFFEDTHPYLTALLKIAAPFQPEYLQEYDLLSEELMHWKENYQRMRDVFSSLSPTDLNVAKRLEYNLNMFAKKTKKRGYLKGNQSMLLLKQEVQWFQTHALQILRQEAYAHERHDEIKRMLEFSSISLFPNGQESSITYIRKYLDMEYGFGIRNLQSISNKYLPQRQVLEHKLVKMEQSGRESKHITKRKH